MRVRGIIILLLVIAGLIIPWVLSTPAFAQWGEVADIKATCSATNPGGESVLSVTVSATYGYDLKNLILRLDNLPTELVLIQSEKSLKLIKHGETQVMTIRIGTKPQTPNGRYLVRFHLYHSIWANGATFEKVAIGSAYLVVGSIDNSPSTSEESDCFIATATYGTATEPKLDVLRQFRDQVLIKNWFGTKFVAL